MCSHIDEAFKEVTIWISPYYPKGPLSMEKISPIHMTWQRLYPAINLASDHAGSHKTCALRQAKQFIDRMWSMGPMVIAIGTCLKIKGLGIPQMILSKKKFVKDSSIVNKFLLTASDRRHVFSMQKRASHDFNCDQNKWNNGNGSIGNGIDPRGEPIPQSQENVNWGSFSLPPKELGSQFIFNKLSIPSKQNASK